METAVNAIWDAGVSVGDTILVVGYGLIGALLAELINKIPGTTVYVAEKQPTRCKKAMDMGLQLWETDTDRQAQNICDIAFHTSAQQEGLETAMNSVGQEGMVIELSWYGDRPIQVRLGGMFHAQRKAIPRLPSLINRSPKTATLGFSAQESVSLRAFERREI